jgi:uncharacterized protein YaiI (UPF0178 family)
LNQDAKPPITIYIDADACPVKAETYRVAERYGLKVYLVSNSHIAAPREPFIEHVIVGSDPNAADDWIAERATLGSIVITADIPLADRCIKAGAQVIAPNGRIIEEASIGMALATRNLMEDLRSSGQITGGPRPFQAARPIQFPVQARPRGHPPEAGRVRLDVILGGSESRSSLFGGRNVFFEPTNPYLRCLRCAASPLTRRFAPPSPAREMANSLQYRCFCPLPSRESICVASQA